MKTEVVLNLYLAANAHVLLQEDRNFRETTHHVSHVPLHY